MRILVVEDDKAVRDALSRALRMEGYLVELVPTGGDALASLAERTPDAVILDVGLPGLDGLETCRLLRAKGDEVPVLMLTARASLSDRVAGLDAGADDYLVKPFELQELFARLRAMLRRQVTAEANAASLTFGDVALDSKTRDVTRCGRDLILTRTEFSLLELFLKNPRQVLTRDVIFERVWGYDFGTNSNSLEVYIGYLRRKLEETGGGRLIHTVRGVGYVLKEAAP
jgi:two-component system, OmpR family, response regulator MprA